MDWQKEQVMNAIALNQAIADTTRDAEAAHTRASQAQESLKDSEEALKDAENGVRMMAVRSGDDRLPKAVSSPAYKAAMDSIVKLAHAGDLADLVIDRNQIKEHAINCAIESDNLRTRLGAMKAQANLQAAILNALPPADNATHVNLIQREREAVQDATEARWEAVKALEVANNELEGRKAAIKHLHDSVKFLQGSVAATAQNPADE